MLTALQAISCGSPVSPGQCVDGHDYLGRSAVPLPNVTCTPRNAQVQCQSMIEYLGYCAGAPLDVTASAQWISTDSSVAVSIGPGLFQMQAPGSTVIYSNSGGLYSPEAFGYRVAAAGVFQQIGVVAPEAETTAGLFIPNATFELTSAAGTQLFPFLSSCT